MTREEAVKLFETIKQDDLLSFCAQNEKENILNLAFGRFPLLSVCYLYNSKKIIKKFEKQMFETNEYVEVFEPFCLYQDLRKKAGRPTRFYAGMSDKIMPLEMLALLGKDSRLKKKYKISNSDNKIEKIYRLKNQKVKFDKKSIKISAKKMKKGTKIALWTIFSSLFSIGALFGLYILVFGLGTTSCPKLIYSESQFSKIENVEAVKLQTNLTLKSESSIGNFNGVFDGNGKTIKIKYDLKKPLFEILSGEIKNTNFVFDLESLTISENLTCLAQTNEGAIKNVNVIFNSSIGIDSENDVMFSLFADINNGSIENCTAKLNAQISKTGEKEGAFSTFASINNGKIKNCQTAPESLITSQNTDVCGICSENNGEITLCQNYAAISQTSNISSWSPNVAGISLKNNGSISKCFNYGDLSVENDLPAENATLFVGGICSINIATISESKNLANIFAKTQDSAIVAGGICAYCTTEAYGDNPVIQKCGAEGEFDLSKTSDDAYIFCGGIAGAMRGTILETYSLSTFKNAADNTTKNQTGLIFGLSYGYAYSGGISVSLNISSVYCLSVENVSKTLSAVLMGNTYYTDGDLSADIHICNNEEVKESSVYWE